MSCEKRPGKVAQVAARASAGIAELANKRGFYVGAAGLVLGSAPLLASGLALMRSSGKQGVKGGTLPPLIDYRTVPHLTARTRIAPTSATSLKGEYCGGCQSVAESKPGLWYKVGNQPYCRDCAPAAARAAKVDLIVPPEGPPPVEFRYGKMLVKGVSPDQAAAANKQSSGVKPFPFENKVPINLIQTQLAVSLGFDAKGQSKGYTRINNGLHVHRLRGGVQWDTGLALTPDLKPNDQGQLYEDMTSWHITHVYSGFELAGPYTAEQASDLAAVLAQTDEWSKDISGLKRETISRAIATVKEYNRRIGVPVGSSVAETQAMSSPDSSRNGIQIRPLYRVKMADDLNGKLVVDDAKGEMVIVLADQGEILYVMDQGNTRYNIRRKAARTAAEDDFERTGVAMAFDTASSSEVKCVGCGGLSHGERAGSKWYIMAQRPYCATCAADFCFQEGYLLEDRFAEGLSE